MRSSLVALQAQSPSRRALLASAVLVAAATLIGLKSSAGTDVGTRGGEVRALTASHTAMAVPLGRTSASADPKLVRLIELHRSTTYVPGALAQLPQDRACCLPVGEQ